MIEIAIGRQHANHIKRLAKVMRRLGWENNGKSMKVFKSNSKGWQNART